MNKIDLIIDALEKAKDGWQSFDEYEKALTAARELKIELAKLAEPPDYVEPPTSDYHNGWEEGFEVAKNLYPKQTKREWVGLTDDAIEEAWGNTPMMLNARDGGTRKLFARAIEAKLKEKNHGNNT